MSKNVVIIDYGLGNLFSVKQAFIHLGVTPVITIEKDVIANASALVLPGVGAFGEAMDNLRKLDLIIPILDFIGSGKPFLGVCLGMQLLFEESEEFGNHKGLAVIPGSIKKFPKFNLKQEKMRVPQIGWNQIKKSTYSKKNWENTPLSTIRDGEYMYFVHSFYAPITGSDFVLSETTYEDITYCSSVLKNNVFAAQFHPEKSAGEGLNIYKNWIEKI